MPVRFLPGTLAFQLTSDPRGTLLRTLILEFGLVSNRPEIRRHFRGNHGKDL